jgi:hypothetical protein
VGLAYLDTKIYVGFEVFTAVVTKSIIFRDLTPCSPLSCNRSFGGTYRLHLQGRRIISARISRQAGNKQNLLCVSLAWNIFESHHSGGTCQVLVCVFCSISFLPFLLLFRVIVIIIIALIISIFIWYLFWFYFISCRHVSCSTQFDLRWPLGWPRFQSICLYSPGVFKLVTI